MALEIKATTSFKLTLILILFWIVQRAPVTWWCSGGGSGQTSLMLSGGQIHFSSWSQQRLHQQSCRHKWQCSGYLKSTQFCSNLLDKKLEQDRSVKNFSPPLMSKATHTTQLKKTTIFKRSKSLVTSYQHSGSRTYATCVTSYGMHWWGEIA